jgi:hypothetical protein
MVDVLFTFGFEATERTGLVAMCSFQLRCIQTLLLVGVHHNLACVASRALDLNFGLEYLGALFSLLWVLAIAIHLRSIILMAIFSCIVVL